MDVARCALRLGADVTVVYRRTLAEMPAIPDEIEEAKEEGVKFEYLASPKEIIEEDGMLSRVVFQKMKLGEPDESGRRTPVPVEGEEFSIDLDNMFTAIGETADLEGFSDAVDTEWNLIKVSGDYGLTSREGFFAGGDIVTGAASVVEAIAAGRKAAEKIDRLLRGIDDPVEEEKEEFGIDKINTDYFPKVKKNSQPRIVPEKAGEGFSEIMKGFDEELVQKEAERCFSCGVCNYCDNCWIFCPDAAIIRREDEYEIDYDYCKGCLVCVQECPRNVFVIEEE
jgi:NADPH-dependent glutamate synthase beta subunit-like oxidoreductase